MSLLWALPVLVMALAALCTALIGRRLGAEVAALEEAVDALDRTRTEVAEAIAHLEGVPRASAQGRTAPDGRR